MDRMEKARALRNDPNVHYNCAQSVLLPYASACGLTEETAMALAANLGGGMKSGSACGALVGAVLALGGMGYGEEVSKKLIREFREANGCLDCADLLRQAVARGEERKPHCDGLVYWCMERLEELVEP